MRTHQRLLNEIADKVNSLGKKIKPTKCRSFSIRSGKPSKIDFLIEGNNIPSIANEDQTFLERLLFLMESLRNVLIS